MSFENRSNQVPRVVPIYTVYPGSYQGNVNNEYSQSHPQGSPPKYEDVVNGSTGISQPRGTHEVPEHTAVVYIAPVKYTTTQKTLASIFTILFLAGFVSVLIKILSFH